MNQAPGQITPLYKRCTRRLSRLWHFTSEDCEITIRVKQRLLPFLFALSLIWYITSPTAAPVSLFVGLAGFLGFSFLWARIMAVHVSAKRTLRHTALQVGDELEEIITLKNKSLLPVLWAEFCDHSDIPDYRMTGVRGASASSIIRWRVSTICSQRGIFKLGPWELRLGDPFGIFVVILTYTQSHEILIYPPLAVIPAHLLPHNAASGITHPLRQPLSAETINAFTTRPYQPGDPLRHIHWRTTARRDENYVKVFEPEASSNIWLIPDFDAAVHIGEGDESTVETMVILLAALSHLLLSKQLIVGMYAHTQVPHIISPKRGKAHIWSLLRAIAPLQPAPHQDLTKSLAEVGSLASERDMFIVITPSLNTDWPRKIRSFQQHTKVTAFLLDPHSFGGRGDARSFAPLLAELGISCSVVRRGDIRPIQASYGALRRWEFKTLSTGRAILQQTPREVAQRPGHDPR
ncbi:MAG: DUF58 domain-containing protein [Anaerolineaceae bacterium]|nr:DUF58 domain-containing protein [Anaerolineaceae bacterium]